MGVRYGDLFRTHVFGHPTIVTTTPEAAKFVLVEHPSLFQQRGLPFVEDALGTRFFGYVEHHNLHVKFRKQLQSPLLHLDNLIPQIEAWALCLMRSWEGRTVNALHEAKLVRPLTTRPGLSYCRAYQHFIITLSSKKGYSYIILQSIINIKNQSCFFGSTSITRLNSELLQHILPQFKPSHGLFEMYIGYLPTYSKSLNLQDSLHTTNLS